MGIEFERKKTIDENFNITLKKLYNFFFFVCFSKSFTNKSVWDELIRNYNNEAGFDSIPKNLRIPDYVNFLYNVI